MHSFLDPILNYIHGDGLVILPQMELLLFALGILIFDFLLEKREKHFNAYLALTGVAAGALGLYMQYKKVAAMENPLGAGPVLGFQGSVIVDGFSLIFGIIFLAATALVVLLSIRYMEIEQETEGEYYALILLAAIGMMFMASGMDLVVLFLGLETMALSFYVLVGFLRREKRSNEAALKYLLLGGFGTGILAYGFSFLYGISASTNIANISSALDHRNGLAHAIAVSQQPGAAGEQMRQLLAARLPTALHLDPFLIQILPLLAFVLVAAGMFFKIAAVPFHQWTPDVYEGAPTPISAYVSVASKTASFAMFIRLLTVFSPSAQAPSWLYLIAGVAIASLTWGNLAALTQTNLKRLFAYSSISHVGYILLGVVAWNETGLIGIFYYLIAYAFMTIGAFAIVIVLHRQGLIGDELSDLDGLYRRSPGAAVLLLIFMLSLAGIPPTAGFMGKYFIFQALIQSNHWILAIFAALYIVPAVFYYFRVIVHAWLKKPGEDMSATQLTSAQIFALVITVFVTLAAGLYPEPFTHLARYALGQ